LRLTSAMLAGAIMHLTAIADLVACAQRS